MVLLDRGVGVDLLKKCQSTAQLRHRLRRLEDRSELEPRDPRGRRYLEVVEPQILVLTLSDQGEPHDLVTVVLVEIGGYIPNAVSPERDDVRA
jgi:hypothetical protein